MRLNRRLRFGILAAVVVLALAGTLCGAPAAAQGTSARSDAGVLQMCRGEYALCDAALCTPLAAQSGAPGSPSVKPTHALCACVVENGQNLGPGPCENRVPSGPHKEYIMSTYSFGLPNPYLTCPKGNNRTVCFGYPCIIDKHNAKLAHCTCPITYDSEEFLTQGGGCNVASCSNGLWQGGTAAEYALINEKFSKATGQKPPPDCAAIVRKK
jgi:Zn-finger protein